MHTKKQSLTVFCRTQFEGFHCWPQAPDEVAFLRTLHRHMFHVELHVEVHHDDRDVEFILLKRRVDAIISGTQKAQDTSTWSCEQWCRLLMDATGAVKVAVSEDGENGSVLELQTGGEQ